MVSIAAMERQNARQLFERWKRIDFPRVCHETTAADDSNLGQLSCVMRPCRSIFGHPPHGPPASSVIQQAEDRGELKRHVVH